MSFSGPLAPVGVTGEGLDFRFGLVLSGHGVLGGKHDAVLHTVVSAISSIPI